MIEVPKDAIIEVVKASYDLSRPIGLGFLHFKPGPLSNEEAESLIDYDSTDVVNIDYLNGRCVKFNIFKSKDGLYYMNDRWYDHSDSDVNYLIGIISKYQGVK